MKAIETKLLVVLVLMIAMTAVSGLKVPQEFDAKSLLSGRTASSMENAYDDTFPIKTLAVNLWAAFNFLAFHEGQPGVVVGQNGWLFSDEEFSAELTADSIYQSNLNYVMRVVQELEHIGVQVVVLPLPTKASIYPEYIAREQAPIFTGLYKKFVGDLEQGDVSVIDLRALFLSHRTHQRLFLRTDTHWTPEGAALTARHVSEQVRKRNDYAVSVSKGFPSEHKGDLFEFLPLEPWFRNISVPNETLSSWKFEVEAEINDLFSVPSVPNFTLVGTSYSADERWQFVNFLSYYLQAEVLNLATEGQGPFTPMSKLLSEQTNELPAGSTLIWEIPERYLVSREYSIKKFGEHDAR